MALLDSWQFEKKEWGSIHFVFFGFFFIPCISVVYQKPSADITHNAAWLFSLGFVGFALSWIYYQSWIWCQHSALLKICLGLTNTEKETTVQLFMGPFLSDLSSIVKNCIVNFWSKVYSIYISIMVPDFHYIIFLA